MFLGELSQASGNNDSLSCVCVACFITVLLNCISKIMNWSQGCAPFTLLLTMSITNVGRNYV